MTALETVQHCSSLLNNHVKFHEPTTSPVWKGEEVEVAVDEMTDETLRLAIFHNSELEPHIRVVKLDLDIGFLREVGSGY